MNNLPINKAFAKHEDEIVNHFGFDRVYLRSRSHSFDDMTVYFLCFTNRCGSNAIAEDIGYFDSCSVAGENLNYDAVINNSIKKSFNYFFDYMEWLLKKDGKSCVGVKVSIDQLLFLYDYGYLKYAFPKAKFVLIKRENVLSQAVSLLYADKTKQWTSYQDSALANDEDVEIDNESVMKVTDSILSSNSKFYKFFSLTGVEFKEVKYEEYLIHRGVVLKDISEYLDVDFKVRSVSEKKTKIQKNVKKSEIINRIVNKYSFKK